MGRRRARVDRNHREVVRVLEAAGCTVVDLSGVGGGCPDLLVGYMRETTLIEVKADEEAARRKGKTATRQQEFRATWRGRPVHVVKDAEGALRAVGLRAERLTSYAVAARAPEVVEARRSRRKVVA